ncbi:MAG TPA: hypothetical protein VGA50_04250 [Kiloniellales bacterium]
MTDAAGKHAWLGVKTAVRAYSNHPSGSNAEEVEAAWKRMRRIDNGSRWRELQATAGD